MDRRGFICAASAAVFAQGLPAAFAATPTTPLKPMALGLIISPWGTPEEWLKRVHELGFSNCFLSLDGYIGQLHAGAGGAVSRSAGKVRTGCDDGRSGGAAAAGVGLHARAVDHRPGAPRPRARRASTRCGRPPTLPSCSGFRRCRRTAALFLKIPPIHFIPERSKRSAPSPSIARATGSTS